MKIDDEFSRTAPGEPTIEVSARGRADENVLSFLDKELGAAIYAWPRSEALSSGVTSRLLKWFEYWTEVSDEDLDLLEMSNVEARELAQRMETHGWAATSISGLRHHRPDVFHSRLLAVARDGAAGDGLVFRRC